MACCGKRKKTYEEHKKLLSRSVSRSATIAASIPKGIAIRELPLTRNGNSARAVYVEKGAGTCPTCGTRTVLKRQYSERLRRYFNVTWCSTCKDVV